MAASTFERARREIQYAYEKVAFFRKHMDGAGLVPADIREPADLLRLPPTQKVDYRRSFPVGVIAAGYNLRSRHVLRFQSSGTEGERLVSVVFSYDLARRQATCLEINPRFEALWKPGLRLRTCRYAAPNCSDVECSNPNSVMRDRLLADGTLVLPVYHDLLTTPPELASRALDEIAEYDPHFLFVDPTHFAFLIRQLRKAGRAPHKTRGFCINSGYTLCTRVARRQIQECFGPEVPVADMLGMSELGYLGFECPEGKLHLNARDYHVEFIRDGRPAEPGELAELVLTTLEDKLSPHIRYATGDLYRFSAERCPCGNPLPVVLAEGRAKNMLWRKEGTVLTPRELDALVGDAPWMDLYRMEQTHEDAFSFQFLRNERADAGLEAGLAERLRDALKTPHLKFAATQYLPSDRGGKFISCVSAVAMNHVQRGPSGSACL
ncbi:MULTISPECIES: phenylacetate--CoA ligase family protein [Corallococcus]|uniref:phenylacetate--CoA ligase family protein n=1 Tax=Corallococcus TaxID=83461 RepID=UPI00117DFFD7|nr:MULTISPECIES: phenylacetate--CoA ligase family protein [Corallococcus]NBD08431.1 phenylacetate--CoA ligase family protein [Corallococcus silvisoli]TSC34376.1 phenylacetate--CoA ligase family protein [Corallococcus sp. Z5C101001]